MSRRRCSTAAFVASSATLPPATTWPGAAFAGGGDDTIAPVPVPFAAAPGAASGVDFTDTPPASIGVTVAGPTLSARAAPPSAPPSASAASVSAKREARREGRRGFVIASRSRECFAERDLAAAGIDVILDDRGERPGVMFADWELIGVPHRLVIGERGLKDGKIEYQGRRDAEATLLPADSAATAVAEKVRAALAR